MSTIDIETRQGERFTAELVGEARSGMPIQNKLVLRATLEQAQAIPFRYVCADGMYRVPKSDVVGTTSVNPAPVDRDCKSPTHRRYRDATEGLFIQTRLAVRDLQSLLAEVGGDSTTAGTALTLQQHRIVDAEERLAFGRQQLADATFAVNRHFDSGCRNLREVSR